MFREEGIFKNLLCRPVPKTAKMAEATSLGLTTILLLLLSLAFFPVGGRGDGFPADFELFSRAIFARSAAAGNLSADTSAWHTALEVEGSSISSRSPVHVYPQKGLMEADKIPELPGQPRGVDFNQYSGYVTVDPKAGRALFYYFVESPGSSASQKPLVLWLNGGPGCSSLGVGAMMELGPFRVNRDGKTLQRHVYAWNKLANIIFLESPAGVGFSYSKTTSDYKLSGDKRTAKDAYAFLVNWLERFPHYKTSEFYIVGESYAGHYVPQLAYEVLLNNKMGNRAVINLRGIAIGNGLLDDDTRVKGTLDYFWMRDLISDELHGSLAKSCFSARATAQACVEDARKAFSLIRSIYIYDIYAPLCNYSSLTPLSGSAAWGVDPCSDAYVTAYLNDPAVQRALHAKPTVWQNCRQSRSSQQLRTY
ncbi:hypothetical protein Taro_037544 [Colocasia esculenta]|uniref:Carboxypeptidase n=1 Tax=Colocasia esculenta TaxID=4460 RepID=A0A843W5X9_COLES|nr:hypothetical protein [Colocasia esculenta]